MMHFAFRHRATDPDERRRGTLFNIFLAGVLIPVMGLLAINAYHIIIQVNPNAQTFLALDGIALLFLIALWLLHRRYPIVARHIFLLFISLGAVLIFFDIQSLDRLLIVLTFPVLMAPFLIQPGSSFTYAGIVVLAYSLRTLQSFMLREWGDHPLYDIFNYPSMLSLFGIALVAWVVSSSLDRALAEARQRARELHILNEELDQRVQDRTQELAEALEREHTLAMRNQTILESIGDGVLVTDKNKQIIIANPAANRLAQRNLKNKSLHEALADVRPESLTQIKDQMAQAAKVERPNIQFEWNERTIAANIAPVPLRLPGQKHTSTGNVMVLRDVTREAEIDRMKTIFLGSVSHELRTPLAAIRGYVEFLLETTADSLSKEERNYLQIVSTNIRRLTTLANDLIDLSRIEVGELALYRGWTRLESIVRMTVETVKPEFEKRGLSLEVQIEPDLPLLHLDRNRIVQALLNLLTNAYKYTVEGGATLKASHINDTIQIEISDTGIGLTEEDKRFLFDRFYRAHNEVVQKSGGSGLGLAITKNLIELHGGTISFHSEHNVGTTFTITLPIPQNQPAEA